MKLNKLFHLLYFSVMALPLVVAPIFALYTTNKNASFVNTIQFEEDVIVNLKQEVINGKPSQDLDNWEFPYVEYYEYDGFVGKLDVTCIEDDEFDFSTNVNLDVNVGDKLLYLQDFTFSGSLEWLSSLDIYLYTPQTVPQLHINNYDVSNTNYYFFTSDVDFNFTILDWYGYCADNGSTFTPEFFIKNIQVFNLTSIFGSGNEPTTYNDFKALCPLDYYDYGVDYSINVGTRTVTYNDTDIGSQFIYSMYNCVDKYFNYDNVVNFGALYGWLNTTFFSGSAPLGFFIFWHLLEYWLLTSLLWLLFDVLMYVPMLVHRWLDKASLS